MNKKRVINKIGQKNWGHFSWFMKGQTVGIGKDDEVDFYEYDVERFMNSKKYKP